MNVSLLRPEYYDYAREDEPNQGSSTSQGVFVCSGDRLGRLTYRSLSGPNGDEGF